MAKSRDDTKQNQRAEGAECLGIRTRDWLTVFNAVCNIFVTLLPIDAFLIKIV